jgi:hypothetical protein
MFRGLAEVSVYALKRAKLVPFFRLTVPSCFVGFVLEETNSEHIAIKESRGFCDDRFVEEPFASRDMFY